LTSINSMLLITIQCMCNTCEYLLKPIPYVESIPCVTHGKFCHFSQHLHDLCDGWPDSPQIWKWEVPTPRNIHSKIFHFCSGIRRQEMWKQHFSWFLYNYLFVCQVPILAIIGHRMIMTTKLNAAVSELQFCSACKL